MISFGSFALLTICEINPHRKLSCLMVQDLLLLAQKLEHDLGRSSPMMQFLRPSFTLVGSVAEGTRIGLGSELDLTVRFLGLEDVPFKFRVDDPFHLYEGGESPECLSWYFEDSKFQLHRFKQDVLDLVDSSLMSIFDRGDNPPRLSIKQPNRHSEATLRDTALIVSEGKSIYG